MFLKTLNDVILEIFIADLCFEKYGREAYPPLLCLKKFHWNALDLFPLSLTFTQSFVSHSSVYIALKGFFLYF